MGKKSHLVLIILLILFALMITALIYYGFKNVLADTGQDTGTIIPDKQPDYHFAVICQDVDDPFWLSIIKGAKQAAGEFNVAVEFNGPRSFNVEDELKYLNIAIASKVDGIASHVPDETQAGELINKAISRNIPVVTVQTDAKDSNRISFIGANMYDFGVQQGKMLVTATEGVSNSVVLVNSVQNGNTTMQNLMISGIKDAIKQYPRIKIQTVQTEDEEFLGVEDKVKDILENHPDVGTIICTTERDTISVAQLLVDLNKVGCNLIGYGESPAVLRYIVNGVIYGTVTGNPEKMGYDAIKALVDIKKNGRISAYFPVDLHIVTRENVANYMTPEQK